MKIYCDISLERFEAWSGGEDTLDVLREKDLCDQLENILEDIFPDGCTDTELNDLLWFERDTIAEWLGFSDWDDLESDGEDEEDEEEEIEIEYEFGVTEQEFETADDFCDHYENDCEKCPYNEHCVAWADCEQRFNLIVNQMI